MFEVGFNQVAPQGFIFAFRPLAATVCAMAFLFPAADAAAKKGHETRRVAASVESKRIRSAFVPARSTPAARRQMLGGKGAARSERFLATRAESRRIRAVFEPTRLTLAAKRRMLADRGFTRSERFLRRNSDVIARMFRRNVRISAVIPRRSALRIVELRPSFGQLAGLHATEDALDLKSSVALVVDQDTREVLLSKNDQAVLPIASLTKLMTGLLISEARLPFDEPITITEADIDTEKGSHSRLAVGTTLPRGELLHLALMASENRAAHALGRTYPGGIATFVSAMNAKARMLGMTSTRYVEPTGLSSRNQSSAQDLALLVNAANADAMVRQLSTSPEYSVEVGNRLLQFNTTNRLVKNPDWDIGVQKTGYISEAGQCLVMQARIAGRKLIMVFLDSTGKFSRIADAERVRHWVEARYFLSNGSAARQVTASRHAS
jgi:D-alanyl-D-alanine endopeptidase (penicillin-binding protein 7)